MIGLDTNVVVQFLTRDDADQASKARALIERGKVWISTSVILETAWVLLARKGIPKADVVRSLEALSRLPNIVMESAEKAERALNWAQDGLDIADAFHLAGAEECASFASFDRRLRKRVARMHADPPVSEP